MFVAVDRFQYAFFLSTEQLIIVSKKTRPEPRGTRRFTGYILNRALHGFVEFPGEMTRPYSLALAKRSNMR